MKSARPRGHPDFSRYPVTINDDFAAVYAAIKPVLEKHSKRFSLKANSSSGITLETKSPSPFQQHKGQGLFFAGIRIGKAYVSFHLMPIYMCPELNKLISPGLKKRMQGKACFNFKTVPEPALLNELKQLTDSCVKNWAGRKWL